MLSISSLFGKLKCIPFLSTIPNVFITIGLPVWTYNLHFLKSESHYGTTFVNRESHQQGEGEGSISYSLLRRSKFIQCSTRLDRLIPSCHFSHYHSVEIVITRYKCSYTLREAPPLCHPSSRLQPYLFQLQSTFALLT